MLHLLKFNLLDLHEIKQFIIVVALFDITSCEISGFTFSYLVADQVAEFLVHAVNIVLSSVFLVSSVAFDVFVPFVRAFALIL